MPFETIELGIEHLRHQNLTVQPEEESDFYLPLLGKCFASSDDTTDLAHLMQDFTNSANAKRVCTLFGDGGAGKSTFLKQFTLKLWQEHTLDKPIPLFISLPLLDNPIQNAIEETLTSEGFSESQIAELKARYSFVFILDGYDELHQLTNLYRSNHLSEWNAKTIISCRTQYLYNKRNADLYFMPFSGEREQPQLLQTYYVAPFNQSQIESYLEAMRSRGVLIPDYEEIIRIPGLQEIITTPFLLHLVVEVFPEILARYQSENIEERHRLTQTDLYKGFLERWFVRQEQKLKDSGYITADMLDQKLLFRQHCETIALIMYENDLTWLDSKNSRFSVFFKNTHEAERLRSACPLRIVNGKLSFWHASLIIHLVGQRISQEATSDIALPVHEIRTSGISTSTAASQSVQERPTGEIHKRLITDRPEALSQWSEDVERNKDYLFDIIERSKTNEYYAVGAANAISILNYARVSFSGLNFEKVKIARANLGHANLSHTCFKSANLKDVNFQNAFMYNTDFQGAEMTDSQFGESYISTVPELEILGSADANIMDATNYEERVTSREVTCLSAHPNAGYIASIAGSCRTVVVNIDDARITKTIEESGKALAISSLHQMAVGYENGSIRLLNLQNDARINISSQWTAITSLCFSPGGEILVGSGKSPGHFEITLWHANSGEPIGSLINAHTDLITSLSFVKLNEEELLISGSKDATIRVWNLRSRECILILQSNGPVECLAANAITALLISGGSSGKIEYWDLRSGLRIGESLYSSSKIVALTLSSDGNVLVTGNVKNKINVWQVGNYRSPVYSFTGHGEIDSLYGAGGELKINSLLFVRDKNFEEYLAVAVGGSLAINFILRRNLEHPVMRNLQGKSDFTNARVRFDRDSDHQISILDQEGSLIHYNSEKNGFSLKGNYPGKDFYFLENADAIAAVDNKRLTVFHTQDRRELFVFDIPDDVDHYILSNTGKYLITCHGEELILWNTQSRSKTLEFQIRQNKNFQICCFDKSDSYLAIANSSQLLLLWDLNRSCYVRCNVGNRFNSEDKILSMTFSEDHEWLVVHCISSPVVLWNIRRNVLVKTINDQMNLKKLVLSPGKEKLAMIGLVPNYDNGTTLFSACSVVIWDVVEEKYLTALRHFPDNVTDLTFNAAGDLLLINAPGLQVQLWKIAKDKKYFFYDAQLLWSSHSHLYSKGIDLDQAKGLTPLNEDLLARRHSRNKKTLAGALSAGQYESVVWYINRYRYRPDNRFNSQGITPLIHAAARGRIRIAELFLRYGVDINFRSLRGKYTPLMLALKEGHVEMALWLIHVGANVNTEDSDGFTPLFNAIDKEMIEVIIALMDKGADITHRAQDRDRLTPLKLALLQNKTDILKLLFSKLVTSPRWVEVISELFEVRASAWVEQYFRNCVSLLEASTVGDIRALENQIRFGIPINMREKNSGCTPLLIAIGAGQYDAMLRLLELGSSLDEVNFSQANALHLAAIQGHLVIVKYLTIEKKMDIFATQCEGRNPLCLAMIKQKLDVARHLLDYAKTLGPEACLKYQETLQEFVEFLWGDEYLVENEATLRLKEQIPEITEFLNAHIVTNAGLENESDDDEFLSSASGQSRERTAASITQPGTTFSRTNNGVSNDKKSKCIIS